MRPPRRLSAAEQAAWADLAASVTPLPGKQRPVPPSQQGASQSGPDAIPAMGVKPARAAHSPGGGPSVPARSRAIFGSLDSRWERLIKRGRLDPDLTFDLHGHTLTTAYERIMAGLDQARMMDARVVLVIAGRERVADPADRSTTRGAIRAQLLDWLAASRHSRAIAAVRRAHPRHGGEGALYLILKRRV